MPKLIAITEHAKQQYFDRCKTDFEEKFNKAMCDRLEVVPVDKAFKIANNGCKVRRYFRMDDLVLCVSDDGVVITVLKWIKPMFTYKNTGL